MEPSLPQGVQTTISWQPATLASVTGHQRRRDERRGAAGNVNAHAPERIELLADGRAVRIFHLPVFAQRFSGKGGDVFLRPGHGGAQRFIGGERGIEQFRLRDGNRSAASFAPSNFSVNSSSASSPRVWTASRMARVRFSISGSNRLDDAAASRSCRTKFASVWRMTFMLAD